MVNDHLATSPQALDLLKRIEKFRAAPYDDQTGKPITEWCKGATIGYGYLIPLKYWPLYTNGINKPKALLLLTKRLAHIQNTIRHCIHIPLEQHEFDALVLLAYNIGEQALRKSSAVQLINDPNAVTHYVTLEAAWKAYCISQGQENDGLKNRRQCEWNIWTRGIYEHW